MDERYFCRVTRKRMLFILLCRKVPLDEILEKRLKDVSDKILITDNAIRGIPNDLVKYIKSFIFIKGPKKGEELLQIQIKINKLRFTNEYIENFENQIKNQLKAL
jgi:hypothetical protein